jgi:hypothetical protein
MSKLVPQETVDALRNTVNVALNIGGFPCTLYIPNNYNQVMALDAYSTTNDYEFTTYTCNISVSWNPNKYHLKNLGLFVEGELPILVTLPNQAVNEDSETVDIDIIPGSYVKIPIYYIPDDISDTDEFELVDTPIESMHEIAIKQRFKAVPRRAERFKE